MPPNLSSDRRTFVKWVVALPLFGQIGAQDMFGKAQTGVKRLAGNQITTYKDLGVRTLINARNMDLSQRQPGTSGSEAGPA